MQQLNKLQIYIQTVFYILHIHLKLCDYHVFGPLKEALGGNKFSTDEEIKDAMNIW